MTQGPQFPLRVTQALCGFSTMANLHSSLETRIQAPNNMLNDMWQFNTTLLTWRPVTINLANDSVALPAMDSDSVGRWVDSNYTLWFFFGRTDNGNRVNEFCALGILLLLFSFLPLLPLSLSLSHSQSPLSHSPSLSHFLLLSLFSHIYHLSSSSLIFLLPFSLSPSLSLSSHNK
jgi:hypothetical protein